MNQKVAIITGGASGLGLATAQKFCAAGIRTIITGRNADKLKAAEAICGANCVAKPLDMRARASFRPWISDLVEEWGSVDILVNNAGINLKKPLLEVTDEDFTSILDTNLIGLFALTREVVRIMAKRKRGAIINISSMAACYGIPYVIAYTASKAAVDGMTQAMAVELAPYGIRVNAVAPGFIKTPMTAKALDSDPPRKQKVFSRTPMGRMGDPSDIANAIYFLAGEEAGFITGEIIRVDGGNAIGF